MTFIDTKLVKQTFDSGLSTYDTSALVQKKIVNIFIEKLRDLTDLNESEILEIGCGTGFLTHEIIRTYHCNKIIVNDISSTSKEIMTNLSDITNCDIGFLEGDAEDIKIPTNLDAVLSCSTIQWFQNLRAFFDKISYSLKDEGIFAFSTFGSENFKEIKLLTGVGLRYQSKYELVKLLENKFDILYSCEWIEKKQFATPLDVLRHMKNTGVNGIKKQQFGKKEMNEFTEAYIRNFTKNDKVELTYNPIIIIAKRNNNEK